ncbi:helix-turn-helix transcriptional regulator [Vandammella animalimorsus]|nr:AraC family transcriptional regulator [Vandammella animalimorsus]
MSSAPDALSASAAAATASDGEPLLPFDCMQRNLGRWLPVSDVAGGRREARSVFAESAMRGCAGLAEMPGGLALCSFHMHAPKGVCFKPADQPDASALTLFYPIAGGMSWRDSSGQREHVDGEGAMYWGCGVADCQRGQLVHPGTVRYVALALPHTALLHWLAQPEGHLAEQRLLHCLRRRNDLQPINALPMNAAMRRDAARLLALHMAWQGSAQTSAPGMPLAHSLQLEGLALGLLGQWLALPDAHAHSPLHARQRRAVDEALDIIHAEYAQPLSIHALARRTGTNECYLKRDFKARTGLGVAAYLRQLRMQQAAALLEEGRWSVQEVARHVGYASASRFARAFAQAHGHLPSSLREAARGHTPS